MRISREDLLRALESVKPGLSGDRDTVEQSSCFVFKGGGVVTYQDEIACRCASGLPVEVEGAVSANPLLGILRKLPEEEVEIEVEESELHVRGKGKKTASIRLQKEILLPVHAVEVPTDWKDLHLEFPEAIGLVAACASRDADQFKMTCVHVHPKWVEAGSNYQICRWKMKTGLKDSCLIRATSARNVAMLSMTEVSETQGWLHFRNATGLVLSCRRYVEDYPDIGPILADTEGHQETVLPKGLMEAIDRCSIFSEDNADDRHLTVELSPGKLKLKAQGATGRYEEPRKVAWDGPSMTFTIHPKLLAGVIKKHNECTIGPGKLRINGGPYTLVTCLSKPPEKSKQVEE